MVQRKLRQLVAIAVTLEAFESYHALLIGLAQERLAASRRPPPPQPTARELLQEPPADRRTRLQSLIDEAADRQMLAGWVEHQFHNLQQYRSFICKQPADLQPGQTIVYYADANDLHGIGQQLGIDILVLTILEEEVTPCVVRRGERGSLGTIVLVQRGLHFDLLCFVTRLFSWNCRRSCRQSSHLMR